MAQNPRSPWPSSGWASARTTRRTACARCGSRTGGRSSRWRVRPRRRGPAVKRARRVVPRVRALGRRAPRSRRPTPRARRRAAAEVAVARPRGEVRQRARSRAGRAVARARGVVAGARARALHSRPEGGERVKLARERRLNDALPLSPRAAPLRPGASQKQVLRYYAFFKEPVAPSGGNSASRSACGSSSCTLPENNTIQVRRRATRSSGFGAVELVVGTRRERDPPCRAGLDRARETGVRAAHRELGLRGGSFVSRSALVNPATGAPRRERPRRRRRPADERPRAPQPPRPRPRPSRSARG